MVKRIDLRGNLSLDTPGNIVQFTNNDITTSGSSTSVIPLDNTIPQNTEGTQFMTISITPTKSGNKLIVDVLVPILDTSLASLGIVASLYQDTSADALQTVRVIAGGALRMRYVTTSTGTELTTFKLRYGPSNVGTAYINRLAAGALYGTSSVATMTVTEIKV